MGELTKQKCVCEMIDVCFNVENKAFCSLLYSLGLCEMSDDSFRVIGDVVSDTLTTLT